MDVSRLSLREMERLFLDSARRVPSAEVLEWMSRDLRIGVRRLAAKIVRRDQLRRSEIDRMETLLTRERDLWRAGKRAVAGVDEAGIGPLAGPVVAAAAVFPVGVCIPEVRDSKQLSPARRHKLAEVVKGKARAWCLGIATVEEIDRMNVYHAGLLAMLRAVEGLSVRPDHLLVDARRLSGLSVEQEAIVRGDSCSFSIAAASILAKVHRDGLMEEIDRRFPGYHFARHKGYPTSEHRHAIRRLGLTPVHRRSFRPKETF